MQHIDHLRKALVDPNPLVVLIKAHLVFERMLNALIESHLALPSALETGRMSFAQKVSLAEALGGLPSKLATQLRLVNTERNRAAHRLEWELSETDTETLISKITVEDEATATRPLSHRFALALAYLGGGVDAALQNSERQRHEVTT